MDDLLIVVVGLKKEVERLMSIRECEQEIDGSANSLLHLQGRHQGDTSQMAVVPLSCHCQVEGFKGRGGVATGPSSVSQANPILTSLGCPGALHNRFLVLELDGELSEEAVGGPPIQLSRDRRSTPHLQIASAKKDRRVTAAGGSR